MEPRSLKYITAACAGEQLNGSPDELVHRVCTNSRKVAQGDLFFALPGEKFDGHDFVDQVIVPRFLKPLEFVGWWIAVETFEPLYQIVLC